MMVVCDPIARALTQGPKTERLAAEARAAEHSLKFFNPELAGFTPLGQ